MLKKINENKHVLLLLYFPIYMIAFSYLEKRVTDKIHIIDCSLLVSSQIKHLFESVIHPQLGQVVI